MRLHRRTQEKVGVYLIRYCRYVHRVITELHSIVHGIRRVRSASTMIFVVPAFFSLFLSLSLFPSYRGHSTNAFSSSGNTSNSRGHTARVPPYSLGCSFLGKKYYRWSSLFSRNNGYSSTRFHPFYHCFIARSRVSVSSSRVRSLSHIDINRISY